MPLGGEWCHEKVLDALGSRYDPLEPGWFQPGSMP